MMHGWYGWHGWGMGAGWLTLVLFAAALIAVIWILAVSRSGGAKCEVRQEPPVEILKRRYAQGEITRDEFERMKRILQRPEGRQS